jgi:hypothetical protein
MVAEFMRDIDALFDRIDFRSRPLSGCLVSAVTPIARSHLAAAATPRGQLRAGNGLVILIQTAPDTSTTMMAKRWRIFSGVSALSLSSISEADRGRARPSGGAGIGRGLLPPNQNTQ